MFDAKSLLDRMMANAGQQGQTPSGGLAGFDLNQLEGMLRNIAGGNEQQAGGGRGSVPNAGAAPASGTGDQGGIADMLRKLQEQSGATGGVLDTLGKVLGQASQGVQEGAGKIGQATGAREALAKATGKSPEEILAKIREFAANNQLATGAALGGLGALVLGTRTGRGLASSAVKLGAAAMIGGLAYKAVQNYQQGKPLITERDAAGIVEAPAGSGFEPAAQTNESALLFIRAMIAAAAADGRIDEGEQAKIVGSLKQAGLDAEAEEFLANELNNPAGVEGIAAAVRSQAEAIEAYTAARLAIEPDTAQEKEFLARLADVLGIDQKLAAHIDAAARGAAA